jgi:CRISPR-associated protein Cas2
MLVVVAYDLSDDAHRTRLAAELENWGRRVQYSVFECDLDQRSTALLIKRMRQMSKTGDSIRIYQVCENCFGKSVVLGGKSFNTDRDFYQV